MPIADTQFGPPAAVQADQVGPAKLGMALVMRPPRWIAGGMSAGTLA